jgi:hypothetical protein
MPDLKAQLDAIDAQTLAPVVRSALNRERATVIDWSYAPLGHGVINPVTAGLYQVAGMASDGSEHVPWSVILKVIHWVDLRGTPLADGYMDEPGDWNYWKREALVFQSGILDDWLGDLVPVRCYAVTEQAGSSVWLWLEHVKEPPGRTWAPERHILAARHFGQFNGAFCKDRPTPDAPWFCRRFLRQWLRSSLAFGLADIASDPVFWEHPQVRRVLPAPTAGRVIDLLDHADRLLAYLERQPQTLSHLDTHYVNLFAREGARGQDQTVVIDWSFLGTAAVGVDLGMQISGNLYDLRVDPTDARAYYEAALEAYLAGLRDAGWRGSPRTVRVACATAAALRLVPFGLLRLRRLVDSAETGAWAERLAREQGATREETMQRWGQAITFLLHLGDEARQLTEEMASVSRRGGRGRTIDKKAQTQA